MIVSINQPAYLPWLGYFHRIALSDVHVVLDHVQFEKNSFTNRNKVRTANGWTWLTVPLQMSGNFGISIDRVKIDDSSNWRHKHWSTIQQSYARAPYFAEHAVFFREVYARQWESLSSLIGHVTDYLLTALAITTRIVRSSELNAGGAKDELVAKLCRQLGATTYVSGPLGRNYLREDLFRESGIEVKYDDYQHPRYKQVYDPFEPAMGTIDLLFNCGPASRAILMNENGGAD